MPSTSSLSMAARNASPAASGEAAPAGRAVTGEAGDRERPGGDDRHGADRGADDLALGARRAGWGPPRRSGRTRRPGRSAGPAPSAGRRRRPTGGGVSRPVGGVAMCRRCSRSLLGAAARPEPTDGVGRCPGLQPGTGPRRARRPYPLRRACRRHWFPRIDRNRAAGAAAADGHDGVPSSGRRPSTTRSAGTRRAGRLDPRELAGVDAVVNLAGAGIGDHRWTDDYKREVLESRTKATALLARTIAAPTTAPRPAVGLGDRLLRRPRRRGARRAVVAGHRVPHRGRRGVGGQHGAGRGRRRPGRPPAHRHRAGGRRAARWRKLLPLFKFGVGGRFGSGEQWMSWISLDDEVVGDRAPADSDVAGPVNLTAPDAGHATPSSPTRSATCCTARRSCPCRRSAPGCCSAASGPTACCSRASGCCPGCSRPTGSSTPTRRSSRRCAPCSPLSAASARRGSRWRRRPSGPARPARSSGSRPACSAYVAPLVRGDLPHDLELDAVGVLGVQALADAVVGGADQRPPLPQASAGGGEVLDRVDLPGQVVQPGRARRRRGCRRPRTARGRGGCPTRRRAMNTARPDGSDSTTWNPRTSP